MDIKWQFCLGERVVETENRKEFHPLTEKFLRSQLSYSPLQLRFLSSSLVHFSGQSPGRTTSSTLSDPPAASCSADRISSSQGKQKSRRKPPDQLSRTSPNMVEVRRSSADSISSSKVSSASLSSIAFS
ncbi:hypothetical protein MLD38_024637 [Melastoma candidum]|uniref:Uncharacterized protein n=1 Tax=Melastoma candidum TaxID=119954 RepID=A0ACB9NTV1_9MYRT|nr:hypothetical protein MLD38_024637 [Melastoma candidum]